jgi:hypothetical protein
MSAKTFAIVAFSARSRSSSASCCPSNLRRMYAASASQRACAAVRGDGQPSLADE